MEKKSSGTVNCMLKKTPITLKSMTVLPNIDIPPIPSAIDPTSTRFKCSIIKGCNYKTNSFESLKRHMKEHNKNKDYIIKQSNKFPEKRSQHNKDSNVKKLFQTPKNQSVTKEIKKIDEHLEDWNDTDNQDEFVGLGATAITNNLNNTTDYQIENSIPVSLESTESTSDQTNDLKGSFNGMSRNSSKSDPSIFTKSNVNHVTITNEQTTSISRTIDNNLKLNCINDESP